MEESLGECIICTKVFKMVKFMLPEAEKVWNAIMTQSGMYDDLKVVVGKK